LHQLHVGLVPAAPDLGAVGGFSTALACLLFALPCLAFPFFLILPFANRVGVLSALALPG
jgi:hypothetical protein